MKNSSDLISPHGGYCKLVTYKLGSLVYDATVAFCKQYINCKDRTFDQMVQAARSGVANIVEGSQASATSKKTELKLTNVAKASQEELLEDYRSFLRQRNLKTWEAQSAEAKVIREARPETLEQLRQVMASLVSELSDRSDKSDKNTIKQEVAANTMICLVNQETYLLGRQVARLANDFENEGGFTERLYKIRSEKRKSD
ncbi:MAG: four helix bundle suffix domain-containing protein [Lentisphaeria bacterium]|nr:four helix bundle suffix domain-containing protein [Lentisphaeria bacterium]